MWCGEWNLQETLRASYQLCQTQPNRLHSLWARATTTPLPLYSRACRLWSIWPSVGLHLTQCCWYFHQILASSCTHKICFNAISCFSLDISGYLAVGACWSTVPFRSIWHVTHHGPHCCVENRSVSQVTKASVRHVQHVTMPKGQNFYLKQVFLACFAKFGLCGLLPHPITCKNYLFEPFECWNFGFVTVTDYLCWSVELIQRVTVTRVCQIDWNGTVCTVFDGSMRQMGQWDTPM